MNQMQAQPTNTMPIKTLTVRASNGVPPGAYHAEYISVEPTEAQHGEALIWRWRVNSGEHKGGIATRITGRMPTPKNSCGRILAGLAAKALSEGDIDVTQFVGRTYLIVVSATATGGTRVESVSPPPPTS